MNAEIVPPVHIFTHSGRSRSGTAATCARWQGSRPASVPGVDSSVRPAGSLGGAVGVRWKQKETGGDQRTKDILVKVPSIWTGGSDRQPWALGCIILFPSWASLIVTGSHRATFPHSNPPRGCGTVLLFKSEGEKKKVQKRNLSKSNASLKE